MSALSLYKLEYQGRNRETGKERRNKELTTEALDLLDRLGNVEAAERAEVLFSRPQDRFPGRYFMADIPEQEPQVQSRRPANSQFDQWGFFLTVNITEVYDSRTPLDPGEYQLWIRTANPKTSAGKDNDATLRTEYVQMNKASGVNSIKPFLGKKGVVFHEEEPLHYTYRSDTKRPDPAKPGSTIWEDKDGYVWFYKLSAGGAQQANGNKPAQSAPAEPSEAATEAALKLIGAEGMDETAFQLAASKDATCKADSAFISALASGKWAADMIGSGKLLRDGKLLVWVGKEE